MARPQCDTPLVFYRGRCFPLVDLTYLLSLILPYTKTTAHHPKTHVDLSTYLPITPMLFTYLPTNPSTYLPTQLLSTYLHTWPPPIWLLWCSNSTYNGHQIKMMLKQNYMHVLQKKLFIVFLNNIQNPNENIKQTPYVGIPLVIGFTNMISNESTPLWPI